MVSWLIPLALFLAVLCAGLGVWGMVWAGQWARQRALGRRLKALDGAYKASDVALRSLRKDRKLSTIPLLHRLLDAMPSTERMQLRLQQAGNPCNLGSFLLMCATMACVGWLVGILSGGWTQAAGISLGAALLPLIWINFLRKRRLSTLDEQFADAVDLIGRALKAGHSFSAALNMAASEMEDPVAEELRKAFEDYSYGKGLEEALAGLARRVGLDDVKFFVTAVSLQRETGGNLVEVLGNISHIIRERFRLQRQVKALSAEGRLSGFVLSVMPPCLLLVLMSVSPEYVELLFDHPVGQTMLYSGAGLQVLGILVIRQLVKVKV